jgi:hypothetical protein
VCPPRLSPRRRVRTAADRRPRAPQAAENSLSLALLSESNRDAEARNVDPCLPQGRHYRAGPDAATTPATPRERSATAPAALASPPTPPRHRATRGGHRPAPLPPDLNGHPHGRPTCRSITPHRPRREHAQAISAAQLYWRGLRLPDDDPTTVERRGRTGLSAWQVRRPNAVTERSAAEQRPKDVPRCGVPRPRDQLQFYVTATATGICD